MLAQHRAASGVKRLGCARSARNAGRRLALAVVLSAVLHGALLAALSGHPSYPAPAPVALHARLIEDAPAAAVATPVSPPAVESPRPSVTPAQPRERLQRKASARAPGRDLGAPETRGASPAALAVPRDPTWYGARELDELPRPLRPIQLPRMPTAGEAGAQGRVVLQLAIDESGAVTDATVVDAEAQGGLAAQTLAALRAARFRPGGKGGRIVKSRVLLELTFDSHHGTGS